MKQARVRVEAEGLEPSAVRMYSPKPHHIAPIRARSALDVRGGAVNTTPLTVHLSTHIAYAWMLRKGNRSIRIKLSAHTTRAGG